MAVNIPLYPFELGNNDAYTYMMDSYTRDRIDSWDVDYLISQFGKISTNEVISKEIVLPHRNNKVKLSFLKNGTVPNLVIKHVTEEINVFHELRNKFPKQAKISSGKMKNLIAYLINFEKVQYMILPASALPCVAVDDPANTYIEDCIDKVYETSDRIELKYIHQMNTDDGTRELQQILEAIHGKI